MRKIKSVLKSHQKIYEEEKPIRWPYMKILREYSTIKSFYPEINPYAEVYQLRDNLYCLYSDSLDAHGDPWMYVIEGPEKAMLIDTGFGLGNLKGLVSHLTHDKPLIVVNTHAHPDHAGGNYQFDTVWCHELEAAGLERMATGEFRNRFIDPDTHEPVYADFDVNDMVPVRPYEIRPFANHHQFDLGSGYLVEAIHLPGHTAGMTAFFDHHNRTVFLGDTTSCLSPEKEGVYSENTTVEALHDGFVDLLASVADVSGVFPGHGPLDQSPAVLQNTLDTTARILKNPENCDFTREGRHGEPPICVKCIYESSAIRYRLDKVYKDKARTAE